MWWLFRSFGWAAMCNLAGTYLIGKSKGVRLSEARLRFCFWVGAMDRGVLCYEFSIGVSDGRNI